jgi:hypothetical protein
MTATLAGLQAMLAVRYVRNFGDDWDFLREIGEGLRRPK